MELMKIGRQARCAARILSGLDTDQKNEFLHSLADRLQAKIGMILAANQQDLESAAGSGMSPALIDRLTLNPDRIDDIADGLRSAARLPDPVGEIFDSGTLDNGLRVHKERVPLGVIAVIYEARPNVTIDIIGLALKTGNAVILRGGSETLRTNRALVAVTKDLLGECGLPADAVQFIDDPDRALVRELLQMYEYVDMLIPRGGAGLHKFCRENSRIPVITGGIGICHLFVDESANQDASIPVIFNAKIQRPSVCNALDTVLVHQAAAPEMLPHIVEALQPAGVKFRAEPSAWDILQSAGLDQVMLEAVTPAGPDDFDTEWLSLTLSLKVVPDLVAAVDHIQAHSTGHSDGILTQTEAHGRSFIAQVDSAALYVNASTRFTDGNQLGLGAEVAISTQRLHARGPMGLRELTTYKWVVQGDYHARD